MDGLCKTDPSMGDLKTRYYDITVTASDAAGNTGSDTCRVVIVPSCDPETDSNCEEYNGLELPNVEDFYYSRPAVFNSVNKSQVLNHVAREELTWEDGLATLDPEEETNEDVDVDVDPPIVTCMLYTQGKLSHYYVSCSFTTVANPPLPSSCCFFFRFEWNRSRCVY